MPSPQPVTSRSSLFLRFVMLAAAATLAAAPAASQSSAYLDAWRWVQYNTGSGLPSNRVFDLFQTGNGTLWVMTQSGMAWSDGFDWNAVGESSGLPSYPPSQAMALDDDRVLVLVASQMFIGGRSGFERVLFAPEGNRCAVNGVAVLGRGMLLVADTAGRLWQTDATFRAVKPFRAEGAAVSFHWIFNGREGTIWALGIDGVYKLVGSQFVRRLQAYSPPSQHFILREREDGSGVAYLFAPKEVSGIWEFGPTGEMRRMHGTLPNEVQAIDDAPNGAWIVAYDFGEVQILRHGIARSIEPLPPHMKNLLFLRHRPNGDLIAGSESGLAFFRAAGSLWSYWQYPSPDLRNAVSAIIRTHDGSVWVGNSLQVEVHHPNGAVEIIREAAGVPLSVITGMAEDIAGNVWISSGSAFYGAVRWDGHHWRHFTTADGLGALNIHRITKDREGRLWFLGVAPFLGTKEGFGVEPGAYVHENGRFKRWGIEEGMPHGRVFAMAQSQDGALWFGSNGGLSRWKKGRWTYWTVTRGLKTDRVFTLDVDAQDRVWLADQVNGICMIDSLDRPTYYTTRDGLLSDAVWEIRADARGKLWVATVAGLCSYDNGIWSKFDEGTGLTGVRLWPILPEEKSVYVGTRGSGTAILSLEGVRGPAPKVVIARPLVESRSALVRWKAFSYRGEMPSRNIETRFRVDDGPWSPWSLSREQAFVDLDPGSHAVQIQGKGLFGTLDLGTTAALVIPTPWYRTSLFLGGAVMLALIVLLQRSSYVRRRREQEESVIASEKRYRSLFEDSPISLWEEDFTDVLRVVAEWRTRGIRDIRSHVQHYPAEFERLARLVRIVDVNRATLALYQASSKEQLLQEMWRLMESAPGSHVREAVCRIAEGSLQYETEVQETTLKGNTIHAVVRHTVLPTLHDGRTRVIVLVMDITARKQLEEERERLIRNLEDALGNVKSLRGLVPICSSCKKVRDDRGYWNYLEQYLAEHSDAVISHGLCPDCAQRLYPGIFPKGAEPKA